MHALEVLFLCQQEAGDRPGAEATLRRTIALAPDKQWPRGDLARLLIAGDRQADAERVLCDAVEADRTMPAAITPAAHDSSRKKVLVVDDEPNIRELLRYELTNQGYDVLEAATGEWLADRIPNCRWSAIAFEPGDDAFLYTRHPQPGTVPAGEEMYHRHVWRHVLGADPGEDQLVFGRGRDRRDFATGVSISEDGRWTVVTVTRGSERTSVTRKGRAA